LDIWPENRNAVAMFEDMVTSWNVGPGGVVGLRYETAPLFFEANGIEKPQWRETLDGIKVMEAAALESFQSRKG